MPRPRNPIPSYLPHKQSGRARAAWTDFIGNQQQRLLPGKFNSPESLEAFARLQLELATSPAIVATAEGVTVAELLVAYLEHASQHYRDADGNPTGSINGVKQAIKTVRQIYGDTPALDFGPLKLKSVRKSWVDGGLARSEVNRRTYAVRRIFKWCASEELIPFEVYERLTTVVGLEAGRTTAHEMEPVEPVDDAIVEATLPALNRHACGLIRFQRLTGSRPGEACRLRRSEIDTTGEVWLYRPRRHKNAHRGKPRVIAIGPKCQELLREFFTDNPDDYLFSPRRAVEEMLADRSANRKTPRYPSHLERNATKRAKAPGRPPADRYRTTSYDRAIARACKKAGVPHWHPNQLRHTFATEVRKQHGLEAAQVLLGHSRADVTQIYAEKNEALAVAVAAKIG